MTGLIARERGFCTGSARRAMRQSAARSGLQLDLYEHHLAAARVEDFVLHARGPRIADAAREVGKDFFTIRHHAQAAGGHGDDHVIVFMAVSAGAGARRQPIAGDARAGRIDLAIDLRLRGPAAHSLRVASIWMSSARNYPGDPLVSSLMAR